MAESLTRSGGQIPVRLKGQSTCVYHHGKSLDLFCGTCQEIACVDCTSSTHNGHTFVTLSKYSTRKKAKLKKLIIKKETKEIPSIKESIRIIDANINETDTTFTSIASEIVKQKDRLKRKVDALADQTLAVYEKLKVENMILLENYKEEHEKRHAVLKKQVQECRTLVQTKEDITLYDGAIDFEPPVILPPMPVLNTASFSPNLMPLDLLKHAFGKVTKGDSKSNTPVEKVSEVPKNKGETSTHLVLQAEQKDNISDTTQLKSTKPPSAVKEEFTPFSRHEKEDSVLPPETESAVFPERLNQKARRKNKKNNPRQTPPPQRPQDTENVIIMPILARMKNGDMWIADGYRKALVRVGKTGIEKEIIQHTRRITDHSFSSENQELWICSTDDNSVMNVTSVSTTSRFNTAESPLCICATMDGHIIVGMSNQITKFNSQGDVIVTTKHSIFSIFSRQIVCVPGFIVECRMTKNIAVSDTASMNVLVMDKTFHELFRYPGHQPEHLHHLISVDQFLPTWITYSPDGCMFIRDIGNNVVHHIGGNGEFYKLLVKK
ncbi:uncharacterized protein LOC132544671 [Ylistrum balloti]|uniref:uncharacterized protein LOC132544671 n=1 Tax=Ylistrum balloti TaxID=509963 RepID=UPI002905D612|nr:uncharacterized protein LOC132544671 [Ylistrum balloti]